MLRKYGVKFIQIMLIGLIASILIALGLTYGFFLISKDPTFWSTAGQWAGAIVTLAGFTLVIFQLQNDREELQKHNEELADQTTWMVYSNGLTTLNIFVEHPELRPYFYGDNIALPDGNDEDSLLLRNRIFAAAELLLDHWESTYIAGKMGKEANDLWRGYMIKLYCKSQVLREFLNPSVEGYRYSKSFRDALEDGYKAECA